jgi:hypothetical protein
MKRIFAKGTTQEQIGNAIMRMVQQVTSDKAWCIEISEWKKPRSNQQLRYLFGVVYPMVLEAGGEALGGYTREDLHDFFLGEIYGWQELSALGRTQLKPLRRTSKMTRAEFTDFLYAIENKCVEMSIGPLPEPIYANGDIDP